MALIFLFTIDKIKDEPQLFLPLVGQEGFRREVESEVDIKATGKLAKVYDALIERNPEWLEPLKNSWHVADLLHTQRLVNASVLKSIHVISKKTCPTAYTTN